MAAADAPFIRRRPGPLVCAIDTTVASGAGAIKVLPLDDTDTRRLAAPLAPVPTLNFAGVSVRFVSGDASTVTVEVTRP